MSSYNGLVNLKMKWGLLRDKDFEHQTKILKLRFRMECSGHSQQGFIDSEEKKRDLWKKGFLKKGQRNKETKKI